MSMHSFSKINDPIKKGNIKKKFNILLVDDDVDASDMFKDILELRGHNVTVLNEGIQCVSKCKDAEYDIIFMDYHMEGIDGVEVADLIKDIFKSKSLIFAYTGDTTNEAVKKFKAIGMNGALIKPVDPNLIESLMLSLEERDCLDKNILTKLAKKYSDSLMYFG